MYDVAPHFNLLHPWLSGVSTQTTTDMPATTHIVTGAAGSAPHRAAPRSTAPHRAAPASRVYAAHTGTSLVSGLNVLGRCSCARVGADHENHEHFERAIPSRTALRLDEYGYSRMFVYNATHLQWQFVVTDGSQSPPVYDVIGDDVMLVQHHHGSFSARQKAAAKVVEAGERM
jgi:hypothetical protein